MSAPHAATDSNTPGAGADRAQRLRRALPNQLTTLRLVMAGFFVVALSLYAFPDGRPWTLPVAIVIFVLASATDALDGWLARRWNVVSTYGRVMDPLADKVLVLAAFVLLAGPSFTDAETGRIVSGVAPWMVVVILARELLVTSVRAVFESAGVSFGAAWAGKLKMILQSAAAPLILLLVWTGDSATLDDGWRRWTIDGLVWATVLATVLSAWPYVAKAMRAGRKRAGER
ncbi:MAG: CDP-diacylglycerol--glycerol-3-phosphate 3-phosphatidyltransferase [Phycisphaeraceae bacterium]|nr:MAG: CDP-diacylglycerol--glycerol-3-phosphate 3-phosphatidyltransferase [Phycisphaeraceae bacterium]